MRDADLYLMTRTCSSEEELAAIWTLVPKEATGYAMTLKDYCWYADKEEDLALSDVLEARFFWKGGEISWQAQQLFTGSHHQRLHQVVLVYDKPVVDFTRHSAAKLTQEKGRLLCCRS